MTDPMHLAFSCSWSYGVLNYPLLFIPSESMHVAASSSDCDNLKQQVWVTICFGTLKMHRGVLYGFDVSTDINFSFAMIVANHYRISFVFLKLLHSCFNNQDKQATHVRVNQFACRVANISNAGYAGLTMPSQS